MELDPEQEGTDYYILAKSNEIEEEFNEADSKIPKVLIDFGLIKPYHYENESDEYFNCSFEKKEISSKNGESFFLL